MLNLLYKTTSNDDSYMPARRNMICIVIRCRYHQLLAVRPISW